MLAESIAMAKNTKNSAKNTGISGDMDTKGAALSQWDGEGGASPAGPQAEPDTSSVPPQGRGEGPGDADAEEITMHVRLIALENLVLALLAGASDQQLGLVHEMSTIITPRPGSREHPLALRAAAHISRIAERARQFGTITRL